jgi:hypothetical protein
MIAKIISRVTKDYPYFYQIIVEFETLVESNYVSKHDSSFGITAAHQPLALASTFFYNSSPCYSASIQSLFPNIHYPWIGTTGEGKVGQSTTFDSRSFQKKIVKARVLNAEKLSIGWRLRDLKRKRKFCLLWKGRSCEIEDLGKGLVKIIKLY